MLEYLLLSFLFFIAIFSVSIQGVVHPNVKISVRGTWGKNATADTKGHLTPKLQTPIAGGRYTIVIKGSKEGTLKNVLLVKCGFVQDYLRWKYR